MKKISRRKFITAAAGVAALTAVSGTFAFYHDESTIDNPLDTNKYGNNTVEKFTPDTFEPGKTVTKEVGVTNTGAYNLVARIKMEEKWTYKGESTEYISFTSDQSAFGSVVYNAGPPATYTATQAGGAAGETDGLTAGDESVVYKKLNLVTALTTAGWYDGGDGYWYYTDIIGPGKWTGALMDSITMANNADMGEYITHNYYSTVAPDNAALATAQTAYNTAMNAPVDPLNPTSAEQAAIDTAKANLDTAYGWVELIPVGSQVADVLTEAQQATVTFVKSENEITANKGYAMSDYVLSITTEVCQATQEAVDATWTTPAVPAAVMSDWNLPANA